MSPRHPRKKRWTRLLITVLVAVLVVNVGPGADPVGAQRERGARPVLLVGGTFTSSEIMWLITFLDRDFDVHKMTLSSWEGFRLIGGIPGSASMAVSAEAVRTKVDRILARSGADRVDIVAISQGAPVVRHYVKNLGGLHKVAGVISLSGVNYGIPWDPYEVAHLLGCGVFRVPVCDEIIYRHAPGDTAFLRALNEPDPTPGDIDYYHVYTESDEAPGAAETIPLPGATNVSVQQVCPGRVVLHADVWDRALQELVIAALRRQPLMSTCP